MTPDMFAAPRSKRVFLSYAREDDANVIKIRSALIDNGFDVYSDHDLRAGSTWDIDLVEAIDKSAVIVLCWSLASQNSFYVRREGQVALAKGKPFLNVSFEPTPIPLDFAHKQSVGLHDVKTREAQWQELLVQIDVAIGLPRTQPILKRPAPEFQKRSSGFSGWLFEELPEKEYDAFIKGRAGLPFWITAVAAYILAELILLTSYTSAFKQAVVARNIYPCTLDIFPAVCKSAQGVKPSTEDSLQLLIMVCLLLAVCMEAVRGATKLSVGPRRINYAAGYFGGIALFYIFITITADAINFRF